MMNWDRLQVFSAVARHGNLARAGRALNVDATTVSRQVRALEQELQRTLFEHGRDGHVLTGDGQRLAGHVEAMEQAAEAFQRDIAGDRAAQGLLRVSVAEGFGTWFIAPRIAAFAAAYPGVTIDLFANSGFLNPSRKEADIAILLAQPRKGPLKTRKLTDYHLGLYTSVALLGGASVAVLPDLPVVSYIPDFIYAPELHYLDEIDPRLQPAVRSSSINAQHQMIATGAGMGVLPCFMADGDDRLARLLPGTTIRRTFWLAVHEDVSGVPRVRAFIEWLLEATTAGRQTLLGSYESFEQPKTI